jgi:CRISPR-associated protein Cas8a1/Csx13
MGLKGRKSAASESATLVIRLSDPGMSPMLRCGLGGLASSLRAILLAKSPSAQWPSSVEIAGAEFIVDSTAITVSWNGIAPAKALEKLFEQSFRLTQRGLINLPGTYDAETAPTPDLQAALQQALKKTFLQHGKSTTKGGGPMAISFEVDEQTVPVPIQPYSAFAHQDAWDAVVKGLSKPVDLAGWAYPGATQRHVAIPGSKQEYSAATALCALFALVGSVSLEAPRGAPGGAGILVVVEPSDLVRFAEVRPRLSPRRVADVNVGGAGDAVLQIQAALAADKRDKEGGRAVRATHAMLLRATPWASQQKSRSATISAERVGDDVLDLYVKLTRQLPTKLRAVKNAASTNGKGKAKSKSGEAGGYYAIPSALRAFVANNLANKRRWFYGFATATTEEKTPRFIHYYWDREGLGALRFEERKGLIAMIEDLDAAEEVLVSSVQQALRQRFGRISDEAKGLSQQARFNRMDGERERLRLAFAGSKTPEQIRAALADLWSRAGTVKELQAGWKTVLPLLRPERWQAARDLALVALASYQGEGARQTDDENDGQQQHLDS